MKFCSILLASILLAAIPTPASGRTVCTKASHYGHRDGFHGRTTASGERFDTYNKATTAHKWLPFGTRVLVQHRHTGKAVYVKVNDRGPFIPGRGLDLSYKAFNQIGNPGSGIIPVCYTIVSRSS